MIWTEEAYKAELLRQRRKQMSKETKIDWTKPLQVMFNGKWHDVNVNGTIHPDPVAHSILRNKPEPTFVWINVYEDTVTHFVRNSEKVAKSSIYDTDRYLHTLKVNLNTGETEKVYL